MTIRFKLKFPTTSVVCYSSLLLKVQWISGLDVSRVKVMFPLSSRKTGFHTPFFRWEYFIFPQCQILMLPRNLMWSMVYMIDKKLTRTSLLGVSSWWWVFGFLAVLQVGSGSKDKSSRLWYSCSPFTISLFFGTFLGLWPLWYPCDYIISISWNQAPFHSFKLYLLAFTLLVEHGWICPSKPECFSLSIPLLHRVGRIILVS